MNGLHNGLGKKYFKSNVKPKILNIVFFLNFIWHANFQWFFAHFTVNQLFWVVFVRRSWANINTEWVKKLIKMGWYLICMILKRMGVKRIEQRSKWGRSRQLSGHFSWEWNYFHQEKCFWLFSSVTQVWSWIGILPLIPSPYRSRQVQWRRQLSLSFFYFCLLFYLTSSRIHYMVSISFLNFFLHFCQLCEQPPDILHLQWNTCIEWQ